MTDQTTVLPKLVGDANFLAHRYNEHNDCFRFVHVDKDLHRASAFLTDEILPDGLQFQEFPRKDVVAAGPPTGQMHFIFHSAYCCSTMLARAFDISGISMSLKEPVILNDLVGWKRRGANPRNVAEVLDQSMNLLARPFAAGERIVVKPSNIVNTLIDPMLAMRQSSRALLLYAPLKVYLRSITKKDIWGRIWVRKLLTGQLKDQMIAPFGMSGDDLLELSDLQVAALGWLAQHVMFTAIIRKYGPGRVRSLNSETFLARPYDTMAGLSELYRLDLDETQIQAVLKGPAFTRHSKLDQEFDARSREKEHADAGSLHADEIEQISEWGKVMAERMKIPMALEAPLFSV